MQIVALKRLLWLGRSGGVGHSLHQSIGFRVGERTKQDGVHEAEDQRVGADAERERENDDEGGARLPRHDADRIA